MSSPTPVNETDTDRKGPAPLLLLLLLVVLAALAWYFLARNQGGIAPSADTTVVAPVEIGDEGAAAREAQAREETAGRERARRAPARTPAAPAVSPATPIAAMSPRPDYPADARRRNEAGRVLLRVDVGADGAPTNIAFVDRSGSQSLDRAAMAAVRDWRFTPARRNGQPVASQVTVPVDFVLPSQEQPPQGLASRD